VNSAHHSPEQEREARFTDLDGWKILELFVIVLAARLLPLDVLGFTFLVHAASKGIFHGVLLFSVSLRRRLPEALRRSSNGAAALSGVDILLVGGLLGVAAAAHYGLASRVVSIVASAARSLSRVVVRRSLEVRSFPTPGELGAVALMAVLAGAALFASAPSVMVWVTGRGDGGAALRALSPVVGIEAFACAFRPWLRAKRKHRSLALAALFSELVAGAALLGLIPWAGLEGAALGQVLRSLLEFVAIGVVVTSALRGVNAPPIWLLAKLPGAATGLVKRLPAEARRMADRLAANPAVAGVHLGGSANAPERFQLGLSDFDFNVAARSTPPELALAVRHADRVRRDGSRFGLVSAHVAEQRVLGWAWRLGNPVLLAAEPRALVGPALTDPIDAEHSRAWALTHAIFMLVRIQGSVFEEGRRDGSARAAHLAKQFKYLLRRIADDPRTPLDELARAGFELPGEVSSTRPGRLFLPPEATGKLLAAAHHLVAGACARACADWPSIEDPPATSPRWIVESAERSRARVDRLCRALGPDSVELTPTGPTKGDPLLVVEANGWTPERWLEWIRLTSSDGPLAAPHRAYTWPLVVPRSLLEAAAYVEHAPLFHIARRAARLELHGRSVRALSPPVEFMRGAALRETVHALLRLPNDLAKVDPASRPLGPSSADPMNRDDHWSFRVRAYVASRLPALSLLLDHDQACFDPAETQRAYSRRYDDALAKLLTQELAEVSGEDVVSALYSWYVGRIERLGTLLEQRSR
jgi:hypothetical protein